MSAPYDAHRQGALLWHVAQGDQDTTTLEGEAEGEKRGELSEGINKRKRMKSIGRDVQESSEISFN